ncbi:MAG: M1 family metallopeptidase [Caldilineaceae bacterium]|nr:M1 family metallopeptidase [Caldilineaceae bacterium]
MNRSGVQKSDFSEKVRLLRWGSLLLCLMALFVVSGCGGEKAAPGEPEITVIAAAPPATPLPPPTETPTPTPTPTPIQPPVPTPVVDLTDRSIYTANLKPAFAGDVDALPNAPHYFIQAELIPGEVPMVRGVQRVRYTNQEAVALEALYFRLYPNLPAYNGTSTVGGVIVDNEWATTALEYDDSALGVSLAGPLLPGGVADITLWFTATLPTSVFAGTAGSGLYGFQGNVYDLAGFYPTIPVYDDEGWNLEITATFGDSPFTDAAYYQVELTLPSQQQAVTAGVVVERRGNGNGSDTWRAVAGPVRAFYAAASDAFAFISEEVEGTTVRSWYQPGGETGAQTALFYTKGSLPVFNRLFGEYPHNELDVVAMPTTGFGMEYAGVLNLAQSFYGEGGGAFAVATPHEVAHLWFFDLVGNDQPDEPWLDESLANYAVYLYYEDVAWPEMRDGMMNNIFLYRYHAAQNLGIDRPVAGPVTGYDASNYINIIYSKGPLFLHALRERMGDDAFFAALLDYAQTHRYGIAYPEDLLAAFRRHTDAGIDDLYQFWITGP